MQVAFKDGFQEVEWKNNSIFIGYGVNELGAYGRWQNWADYADFENNTVMKAHDYWDGGSISYYIRWGEQSNPMKFSDYNLMSPQVEHMNNLMFINDAKSSKGKNNFWHELSVWDGRGTQSSNNSGNVPYGYNSNRYKGFVQFGMWLSKPRVVRDLKSWQESRESVGFDYFDKVLEAVDVIYDNPILKRFWRYGMIVKNNKHIHPYQVNVNETDRVENRWYLLDTNLDPQRIQKNINGKDYTLFDLNENPEIPVFSIANVIGRCPNREWLIYGFSPKESKTNVVVSIPDEERCIGYDLVLDFNPSGNFIARRYKFC